MKSRPEQRQVRQMPPDFAFNNKGPPIAEKTDLFFRIREHDGGLYSKFYTVTASKRSDGLRNNLCRRDSKTVKWGDFTGRAGTLMNGVRRRGK